MKKRLSRAKRKIQKQKLLTQQKILAAQPTMTQAEIDAFFKQHYQQRLEQEAQENIEAQREAFDEFVSTGKVIPPEHFKKFTRFLTKERIGSVGQLPDIDLDVDSPTLNHHLQTVETNHE